MNWTGVGHAPCHHGELLQGMFRDGTGRACRGLVTLPVRDLGTYAEFHPKPDTGLEGLSVTPDDRSKALHAARLTSELCAQRTEISELCGNAGCGGDLILRGDVPVGLGMGSSTSDVLASVRAVAAAFGVRLNSEIVARVVVQAEKACDPLMLEQRPLLFAQRQAKVLEVLGDGYPAIVVQGCTTDGGKKVDTLSLSTAKHEYRRRDVDEFERLRKAMRRALGTADVELFGHVCTSSARMNQRVLAKRELPALEGIAASVGAVGVQVAHSGNVAGLLFDARRDSLSHRLRKAVRELKKEGMSATRTFHVGERVSMTPDLGR